MNAEDDVGTVLPFVDHLLQLGSNLNEVLGFVQEKATAVDRRTFVLCGFGLQLCVALIVEWQIARGYGRSFRFALNVENELFDGEEIVEIFIVQPLNGEHVFLVRGNVRGE